MGCLSVFCKKKGNPDNESSFLDKNSNSNDNDSNIEEGKNKDKYDYLQTNKLKYYYVNIKGDRDNKLDPEIFKDIQIDETKGKFIEDSLNKINELRKIHGVKPLEKDDNLILKSCFLAKRKLLKIPYDNKYEIYDNGEDLGMLKLGTNEQLSAENLIQKWYKEGEKYNYKEPKDFKFQNFAQLIWKNTEKFGIGYFSADEKEDKDVLLNQSVTTEEDNENEEEGQYNFYYMALFYPPGNLAGQYKANVLPRKAKNDSSEKLDVNMDEE